MTWLTILIIAVAALGITGLIALAVAAHKAPLMAPDQSRLDGLDRDKETGR